MLSKSRLASFALVGIEKEIKMLANMYNSVDDFKQAKIRQVLINDIIDRKFLLKIKYGGIL